MAAWLSDCSISVARYEPGQGWLRPEVVGSLPSDAPANWIYEPALAVNGAGTAVVVWTTQVTAGEGQRQVWARVWRGASGWAAAERIGERESGPISESDNPTVALDPAGNGMVVWGSNGIVTVRLVAGSGWAIAERLESAGYPFAPGIFLDASGPGFAVWNETQTAAVARFDPASGWGPSDRFGNADGWSFGGSGQMAFDREGRAVLVWHRSRGRLEPAAIWSTTFDRGVWAPWAPISASGAVQDPHVGLGSAGVGLAAWIEPTGPAFVRRDGLGWGSPAMAVAAPGIDPQALDLEVNGNASGILVWSRTTVEPGGVEASRYVGGRWSARETLRAGQRTRYPQAALDACGNAIVIWSEAVGESVRIWANRFDAGCR